MRPVRVDELHAALAGPARVEHQVPRCVAAAHADERQAERLVARAAHAELVHRHFYIAALDRVALDPATWPPANPLPGVGDGRVVVRKGNCHGPQQSDDGRGQLGYAAVASGDEAHHDGGGKRARSGVVAARTRRG